MDDDELSWIPTRCAAHTIQLAVKDGLTDYQTSIEKLRGHATNARKKIVKERLPNTLRPRNQRQEEDCEGDTTQYDAAKAHFYSLVINL